MAINEKINNRNIRKIRKSISIFLILFLYQSYSHADKLRIIPSFTLSEIYSDNVRLANSNNEEGAFITEFSPGLSARRETEKSRFNLDYRMQNLYNAGGNDKLEMFHQLRFDSFSTLIKNSLFLDLSSNIGQQNNTSKTIANDNLSSDRNRVNVITYKISPYWTPRLKGYADGKVRFSYKKLMLNDNSLASDTENFDYFIRLDSGRRFSRISWFIDHASENQERTNGLFDGDVKFQNTVVELRGHYDRHFSVFSQVGYSDNKFIAFNGINSHKNGLFYSFGAKWKPSERFFLEGAWGNNSFVTIDIIPTRHMHWTTTYRNNKIGTNLGDVWETKFDFRTKRSIWKASYMEETTTVQNVLDRIQSFTIKDEFGNVIIDPVTEQPVQSDISIPTLTDEVYISKIARVSVAYKRGVSSMKVGFFSEDRIFQQTNKTGYLIGGTGSLDWRFARMTSLFIRPSWLIKKKGDSKGERFDVGFGLTRHIPVPFNGFGHLYATIQYRYVNQSSDLVENEFEENRIAAHLLLTL